MLFDLKVLHPLLALMRLPCELYSFLWKEQNTCEVQLGLGFNIVGGTDQQYIANDNSIYVSWIKKDGAAYLDGRLQEGDKILAINGKDLKDLRHKDAVELFRNAGYYVSLKIQRRLQPQNGPVGHGGDGESGGLPLAAILVPGLALAAAAVWILLRYRQRM
ncbi:synaptojanin-2-binding protein isoform X1 [Passer domesticus]